MDYLKRGVLVFVVLLLVFFIPLGFGEGEEDGSGAPLGESVSLAKYDSTLLYDAGPHIDMCLSEQDCSEDCDERSFPPEYGCRMYSADEVDGLSIVS